MSGRPFETFQSEGWYRPSGARSIHYYRPPVVDTMHLGEHAVVTLCGVYGSAGGIRPWLDHTPHPGATRCRKCEGLVTAQLNAPDPSPWFPESPDLETTERQS